MQWVIPYLNEIRDIVPEHKIDSIKGYKVSNKKREIAYGNCLKDHNGKFTINLRLYFWDHKDGCYYSLFLGHLLETLAHEMAHCCKNSYNHGPKHMYYTGLILKRFSKVLKQKKIKDSYSRRLNYYRM